MDVKNQSSNESGQALFEFIMFLPFVLIILHALFTIANSINAGINQQKSLRGYYFQLLKSDSMGLASEDIDTLHGAGVRFVGFNAIGWKEKFINGDQPASPCFGMTKLIGQNQGQTCDEIVTQGEPSAYIKLFNVFGICTKTYLPNNDSFDLNEASTGVCTLAAN